MNSRPLPFVLAALLLATALFCAGCEQQGIDQQPVFPVQGSLFVNNKPATGAMLTLHPTESTNQTSLRSLCVVDDEGQFAFSTYTGGDGAPEGVFVLTAYWPDPRQVNTDPDGESEQLAPDLLGGRFSAPARSPLRVRVDSSPNVLAPVDLNDRALNGVESYLLPKQSP